jgi:hypothetical protein
VCVFVCVCVCVRVCVFVCVSLSLSLSLSPLSLIVSPSRFELMMRGSSQAAQVVHAREMCLARPHASHHGVEESAKYRVRVLYT